MMARPHLPSRRAHIIREGELREAGLMCMCCDKGVPNAHLQAGDLRGRECHKVACKKFNPVSMCRIHLKYIKAERAFPSSSMAGVEDPH